MRIQTFVAVFAVERFDKRIVGRLAGPREVQGYAIRVGSEIEIAGNELATLVDPNGPRIAIFDRLRDGVKGPR